MIAMNTLEKNTAPETAPAGGVLPLPPGPARLIARDRKSVV